MKTTSISPKLFDVYTNAMWLKKSLDRPNINTNVAMSEYEKHLNYQLQNHTIADIALQNATTTSPIKNNDDFYFNLYELEEIPKIKILTQKVADSYNALYPKTGYIREALVFNNRFNLLENSIKPKMNILQKLRVKYFPIF